MPRCCGSGPLVPEGELCENKKDLNFGCTGSLLWSEGSSSSPSLPSGMWDLSAPTKH